MLPLSHSTNFNLCEDFTEAIAEDPGDGTTYKRRAAVRLQLGDLDGADSDCSMALSLMPFDGVVYTGGH